MTTQAGEAQAPDCLVDTSIWARLDHPAVLAVWKRALSEDSLVTCGPLVMEALHATADHDELSGLLEELTTGLRYVDLDASTWRLAFEAQRSMAAVKPRFHRRPFAAYLIAAAAHQHGLAVLHYDRDYDLIAQHGGLRFESLWIAAPGGLDDRSAETAPGAGPARRPPPAS